MILIDAGTGAWLAALAAEPVALLCTHHFRDHCAGAVPAREFLGVEISVPEYELPIFTDPEQHIRQRETYIIYDNLWDLNAFLTPLPKKANPFIPRLRDVVCGRPGDSGGSSAWRSTGAGRRQFIFMELHVDGKPSGQVAGAQVTIGGEFF